MKFRLFGGVAAASLAVGLVATPAFAQTEGADAEVSGLGDIVVTAQRREESLQRAGIAVSAVDSEGLLRAGVSDAADLTDVVPALQVSSMFGPTSNFYLRGVGNFVTNSFTDPAIAFNVDGVIYQRPTSAQASFFDLERVEVLKGPQGTLYGRNATGGAINLITAQPRIGEFGGFVNGEFGNYETANFSGAVNVPLGDAAALRIAGQSRSHDGFYSDGTGDEDLQAVRAQLRVEPTDDLTISFAMDYAQQGGEGAGATVHGLNEEDYIGLYDPRAGAVFESPAGYSFLAGDRLRALVNENYNDNQFWGLRAQIDVDTSIGTLTILPAYRRSELDFRSGAAGQVITELEDTSQESLEVRLASNGDGRVDYILGGYFFHEAPDTQVNYNHQYFGAYLNMQNETTSWAGFGRLNFDITDRLRLNLGARYTQDDKETSFESTNPIVLCLPVVPPPGSPSLCPGGGVLPSQLNPPDFLYAPDGSLIPFQPSPPPVGPDGSFLQTAYTAQSAQRDFDSTTYRVGVEYDLLPQSLIYASFETGYKAGGFHVSIDDPSFDPETIEAITLGMKNRFFDNRLQVNLELFDWSYEDQQVSHFGTDSVGGTEFRTDNVGASSLRGAELEVLALVGSSTTLSGTVQYLDAEYDEFTYNNPITVQPVTGCPTSVVIAGSPPGPQWQVDCSGFRPPQTPELTVMLGIEHIFSLGSAGSLTFNADTRYQAESYTGLELLPTQLQDEFWRSSLQAEYQPMNERFRIAAFVNNIEDNATVGFSVPHPRAPGILTENLRPPRTYGVRVGVNF